MRSEKLDRAYKSLMIIVIVILAIHFAGNLIMPILFSGLISIILVPFADFLESKKLPRGFAAVLTVGTATTLLFGLVLIISVQSQEIVKEVPRLIEDRLSKIDVQEIQVKSEPILTYINEHVTTIEESIERAKSIGVKLVRTWLIGIKDAFLFLILCPIYVFFMLLCREHIFRFIMGFHVQQEEDEQNAKKLIFEVKSSIFHYLKGLFIIMTISGTCTFLGLYFVGIEFALFLGVLTAILTPIPYIGVTISALIPILLALFTKDSFWYVGGVLLVFAIVQFNENYVLIPRIMGKSVNVNPLIIVLSLILFGALTGVIGMILTVPLLAVTKVVISHYPHLKPWNYLLEDKLS